MHRSSTTLTITSLIALAAAGFGAPRAALADDQPPIEEQIVDAFQALFGKHPGERVNHAKGIVAEGEFKAGPEAAALSRAAHFKTGSLVPVTVRFSDATGLPEIPDGDPNASPHGIAVKFHLPDGNDTDIVINSLHFFPVATPTDFVELLQDVAASPPDARKPTKLDGFLAGHPAVAAAGATVATPTSYAAEEYFGINAFRFTNQAGEQHFIRYHMVPVAGAAHLSPAEAAKEPADFLGQELATRLRHGPVSFRFMAQVAAAGDPITDATKPWPDTRQQVELGTLTVTHLVADSEAASKALLFLPGQVTDGIEISDDPLLQVRDGAYAVSFSRRSE